MLTVCVTLYLCYMSFLVHISESGTGHSSSTVFLTETDTSVATHLVSVLCLAPEILM